MMVGRRWLCTLATLGLVGCGDDSSPGLVEPVDCAEPARLLDDGRCLAPGIQDSGCPAGEFALSDGSCQPAGIPAAACGNGFEPSGDGCEPLLPAEPCAAGQMAVPGETSCREVAPCGSGTWGDIPTDAATEFVDASYGGSDSDGSVARPWRTIGEAFGAVAPGATIAVAAGSYAEDVNLEGKAVTLWGVCPQAVEIVGGSSATAAVDIGNGASGTEIHGLAVRGEAMGIAVSGAEDISLYNVWVHDTGDTGIHVKDTRGMTDCRVVDSLVEACPVTGIYYSGATGSIESSVARGNLARSSDLWFGRGINIQQNGETGERADVHVQGCVVEKNHEGGVFVGGAIATIEGSVVRDTRPQAADQAYGRGINVQPRPDTGTRAELTLRSSVIERNHDVGVLIFGSDAQIEATVVRNTLPEATGVRFGRGIDIQADEFVRERANVRLSSSVMVSNDEAGIVVSGSDVVGEGVVVRDNVPGKSGILGRGINVQPDERIGEAAYFEWRGSVVKNNHAFGLVFGGSLGAVEGVVIRNTFSNPVDHLMGDGVAVMDVPSEQAFTLRSSVVESSARVGVSAFSAAVVMGSTLLECNTIELNHQEGRLDLGPGGFNDVGGNSCGCGAERQPCRALTTELEPPNALEP